MQTKKKIAVFLSGRGSNFESIYQDSLENSANYRIAIVISDNPEAKGIERAKTFGLETAVFDRKAFKSKKKFEQQIVERLKQADIELICLAGYMRIVGKTILHEYHNRILNIHPSLLPAFPGLDAQQQAFDHGVKISGCTVHLVDNGIDTGPILFQSAVKVSETDSADSLSKKILKEEHIIYPKAIRWYINNEEKILDRSKA